MTLHEEPATAPRSTILVVDDTPTNLALMGALLDMHYHVVTAADGYEALRRLETAPLPDLILLDVMMPGMDGYDTCQAIKAQPTTRDIPVIFLTARVDTQDEARGFQLGAVDYITKPISPPLVLARVRTHLQLKASADFLRDKASYLEHEVQRRTAELAAIQDVTIHAMASLAETRDNETGQHLRRTQHYVRTLAEALRQHPRFCALLTDQYIATLFKSAPLHDIGKVGIPDAILLKPGKLDADEWRLMQQHVQIGEQLIDHIVNDLGLQGDEAATLMRDVVAGHHERGDGSGYPRGLQMSDIPVAARIVAVADMYDALSSARPYKAPWDEARCAEELRAQAGRGLIDAACVESLLGNDAARREIRERFAD